MKVMIYGDEWYPIYDVRMPTESEVKQDQDIYDISDDLYFDYQAAFNIWRKYHYKIDAICQAKYK